jgi:ABC-2 type transport system permease protein
LAVAGWGEYFPWAIPALYAGAGGAPTVLGPVSYGLIAATALGGLGATLLWWHTADQSR